MMQSHQSADHKAGFAHHARPTAHQRSAIKAQVPPNRPRTVALAVMAVICALLATACTGSSTSGANGPSSPAAPPVLTVPVANGKPIAPTVPIEVKVENGKLTQVAVVNPAENNKPVKGALTADGSSWISTEPLGYGATYAVTADAVGEGETPAHQGFTVTTVTPKDTSYANAIPAPEFVTDTGIGVGLPISIQFRKPVTNRKTVQDAIKVTVDPPVEGSWYWIDDENLHFRAEKYWAPGTKISVKGSFYGLDLGGGLYGAEDLEASYTVHDSWIARADGNTEQLSIEHNGQLVKTMPMSMGDPENPTHRGTHVISEKAPSVVMDSCSYGVCQGQSGYYRETVYNDLRISNDGEFIHNAPWSVGEQGASNVSHGCINLSPENSKWVYDTFGVGDVVEVSNSGGPELPVWDIYGDWSVPWATWKAGNA